MESTNFLSTLPVLVFALVYGVSSTLGDAPKTSSAENPEAARVHIEDVSQYSQVFLSDKKTLPAIDMGNGMTMQLEIEEPSDDDKAMNAARKTIGETPAVMEAAKKKLASLLKNDGELNVPWQNDAWLIRFLRQRNYDVPKTYKLIRSYYNFKDENNEVFNNLIPGKMTEVAILGAMGVLPKRDSAGSRIVIASAKRWDPKKYSVVELLKLGIILAETAAYEPATQLAGVQIIFDADGLDWPRVKQVTPAITKLIIQWILTSAPIKIQGIHVINQGRFFWTMYNVFKPFVTKELRDKIHLHGTNLESLQQYIPATSLPDILGGTCPRPSFSKYEWDISLKSADEEFAKIGSYGIQRKA